MGTCQAFCLLLLLCLYTDTLVVESAVTRKPAEQVVILNTDSDSETLMTTYCEWCSCCKRSEAAELGSFRF